MLVGNLKWVAPNIKMVANHAKGIQIECFKCLTSSQPPLWPHVAHIFEELEGMDPRLEVGKCMKKETNLTRVFNPKMFGIEATEDFAEEGPLLRTINWG